MLTAQFSEWSESVRRVWLSAYDFVQLAGTQFQPELDTAEGCAMAFTKTRGIQADFAIQGGDHSVDALDQCRHRATGLYELYTRPDHIIGNSIGLHESNGTYLEHREECSVLLFDGFGRLMEEDNRSMIVPHHLKGCVH